MQRKLEDVSYYAIVETGIPYEQLIHNEPGACGWCRGRQSTRCSRRGERPHPTGHITGTRAIVHDVIDLFFGIPYGMKHGAIESLVHFTAGAHCR